MICLKEGGRGKWNFHGSRFSLWAPEGPQFGRVEVYADEKRFTTLDLNHTMLLPSAPVFKLKRLTSGLHAVVLKSISARLVVDALDAYHLFAGDNNHDTIQDK